MALQSGDHPNMINVWNDLTKVNLFLEQTGFNLSLMLDRTTMELKELKLVPLAGNPKRAFSG